jgi:polyphosphate glucokinase
MVVEGPATLSIDIGGSKLKASVLGPDGAMLVDRVRVPTPYPLPPERLVEALADLVAPLPPYDRISVGFPGVVREGVVRTAPNLATTDGPGSEPSPELVDAWSEFNLAGALSAALGKPARVVNDADMQGGAVVEGRGVELVITLGTGFGTALFANGRLAPHMELAHHPFRQGETYEEQLGEVARKAVGDHKWNQRLVKAVATLDRLLLFDRLYVGGGNAKRVTEDLGPKAAVVENQAGILGGFRLWQTADAP